MHGENLVDSPARGIQFTLCKSWLDSGFNPVSLNTDIELSRHPGHREAVMQVGMPVLEALPSLPGFPPHLPNLHAALSMAADRFPGQVIALTNADIHITLDVESIDQLKRLPADRFCLSHRVDVRDKARWSDPIEKRLEYPSESLYIPGIDFVAARAETFRAALPFLASELTIGLPWWDMMLPLALMAAGARIRHLNPVSFLHLEHATRYDQECFARVGIRATRHFSRQIQGYRAPAPIFLWSLGYARAMSVVQSPATTLSRLKSSFISLASQSCPIYLFDVLRITESIVCQPSWQLDRRWTLAWGDQPLSPVTDQLNSLQ